MSKSTRFTKIKPDFVFDQRLSIFSIPSPLDDSWMRFGDSFSGENIADFAHPDDGKAVDNRIQNDAGRFHGVIVPAGGAAKISRRAIKRPCDDAADAIIVTAAPRDFANLIKPRDRNNLFVRGDLEDGIRRRVKNR